MRVLRNPDLWRHEGGPVVLAAGFFDGVHRGHGAVIAATLAAAQKHGAKAWGLTLAKHPRQTLAPETAPRLLTCPDHRLLLLARAGLDGCLMLPFDERLAARSPADFVAQLHHWQPRLCHCVVGADWRFGHHARGTPEDLARAGRRYGWEVTTLDAECVEGVPVSSTRIRRLIDQGELGPAAALLGRPFSVLGTVEHGSALGHALGFPTANLVITGEQLPPDGVYLATADILAPASMPDPSLDALDIIPGLHHHALAGLINIGTSPTFPGKGGRHTVELHLLDFDGDLYGRHIEASFHGRIRSEQSFASATALKARITEDIAIARRHFARA